MRKSSPLTDRLTYKIWLRWAAVSAVLTAFLLVPVYLSAHGDGEEEAPDEHELREIEEMRRKLEKEDQARQKSATKQQNAVPANTSNAASTAAPTVQNIDAASPSTNQDVVPVNESTQDASAQTATGSLWSSPVVLLVLASLLLAGVIVSLLRIGAAKN